MRLLVYEHVSATGAGPAALLQEGDAMIRALLRDLAAVPDLRLSCLRAAWLARDLPAQVLPYRDASDFARALRECDAVWLIAPETGACLERLARAVLASERLLLNCTPDAIALTASKRATARTLQAAGVAAVPSYISAGDLPEWVSEAVIKPDDGAGCIDTCVLPRQALDAQAVANAVLQPFVAGTPRSWSMLCTARGSEVLCVNLQHMERRGQALHLCSVEVDSTPVDAAIREMAQQIWHAVPGLRGYVGVDYIETPDGPMVLEINPRLTTAYVTLSERLGLNVAARVLAQLRGGLW